MATNDELGVLLRRATRDLDAPMAMLVAAEPLRRVVAHRGFEHIAAMRRLLTADPDTVRMHDAPARFTSVGVRSYAQTQVDFDGAQVGTLFLADRRRRWFDDEEVRHLTLMSALAGRLIDALHRDTLAALDVREVRRPSRLAAALA